MDGIDIRHHTSLDGGSPRWKINDASKSIHIWRIFEISGPRQIKQYMGRRRMEDMCLSRHLSALRLSI